MSGTDRLQAVLDRLHGVRKGGRGYQARCPAHEDREPSLSVWLDGNDRVAFTCFAGCREPDILTALGMTWQDITEKPNRPAKTPAPSKPSPRIVATYDYTDEHGALLYQVVRYTPKSFRQRRPDGSGGWLWNLTDTRRVLYHLPEVLAAVADGKPVWITEGEKDSDALIAAGVPGIATTCPQGAGKWTPAYSETLRGAKVVLLADNDPAGAAHVAQVAASLHSVAKVVKVVKVADLVDAAGKGYDVADFLAGHTVAELTAAAAAAKQWAPEALEGATTATDPDPDPLALHDDGNAERLLRRHGRDIRYCYPWQSWLTWDGARWAKDTDGGMERRAKDTARTIYSEVANGKTDAECEAIFKHAKRSRGAQAVAAMLKMAQCEVPVAVEALDADPWLLNVHNGTIDLRSGELRPHDRGQLLTMMSGTEYDPFAECPVFAAFLDRILPDPELRAFVQRAAGYTLTGDVSAQCLFFLHGSGANGKSTLLEVLKALLGDYFHKADKELLLATRANKGEGVANLFRRRFVATVEVDEGARLAESLVKELTGGDTINARRLYEHEFTYTPTHKIWLAANHKPNVRGTDDAIWRRIHILPFTVTIPPEERDADLLGKLRAELPGILAWAVEGCAAWLAAGKRLAPPSAVAAETARYREEQDTLGAFMAERCQLGRGHEVNATELYRAYAAWCETGHEGAPMKQTAFGREMEGRGYGKRTVHGKVYRQGLRLLGGGLVDDDVEA